MRNMRFDSQSGLATGTGAGTRNKPVHVVRRADTQHSYEDRSIARGPSLPAPEVIAESSEKEMTEESMPASDRTLDLVVVQIRTPNPKILFYLERIFSLPGN